MFEQIFLLFGNLSNRDINHNCMETYLCIIFFVIVGSINKCWFKFSGWIFGHLKIATDFNHYIVLDNFCSFWCYNCIVEKSTDSNAIYVSVMMVKIA